MNRYSNSHIETAQMLSNSEFVLRFWQYSAPLPYYPAFSIDRSKKDEITLRTIVRKEIDGKYWLWIVKETGYGMPFENVIVNLMETCYKVMIMGKIPDNAELVEQIFPPDKLIISEEERLKTICL